LFYGFTALNFLPGLIEAAFIFILILLPVLAFTSNPSIILMSENLPPDGITFAYIFPKARDKLLEGISATCMLAPAFLFGVKAA